MKILQYNILDGCREEERYQRLSRWLKNGNYDVVGFNELNGWTQTEFAEKMKDTGFSHSCLFEMETSPYQVGIAAKWPIEVVEMIEEEPIYHGLLHVKINHVHFIIVHLTPFESEHREKETGQIAESINRIQEPLVLMGDFNTLSPLDETYYKSRHTYEKLLTKESPTRQHIKDNAINYRPMELLLESGLHDVCADSGTFQYSMPTHIKGELMDPIYLRLDYILVNHYLLEYSPSGEVVRGPDTDTLSDHYPVQCYFNLK